MVFPSWLVMTPLIMAIVLPTCVTSLCRRIVVPVKYEHRPLVAGVGMDMQEGKGVPIGIGFK